MSPENYQQIISSAWQLAEEGGLNSLTVDRISQLSQVDAFQIEALLPATSNIILLLLEDVVKQVALPDAQGMGSKQDQLFDCFMAYYDAAMPYKKAVRKIWEDLCWHPLVVMQLIPHTVKHIHAIVDRVYPSESWLRQQALYLAYQGVVVYSFHAWLYDESADQAKTMAALDTALKQVEQLKSYC